MPVRKAVTRSGLRIRGYFSSYKMGRMIACESRRELACAAFLEFSTAVVSYEEQPLVIEYTGSTGKPAKATPDFLALLVDARKILVEVKSDSERDRPEVKDRLERVGASARAIGYDYLVVSDRELNRKPVRPNVDMLCYSRPPQVDAHHLLPHLQVFRDGPLSLTEANSKIGDNVTALQMLSLGLVRTCLEVPVTEASLLTLPGGIEDEFLLY